MAVSTLKFGADGLIPAIIVHHQTAEVLMLGYMNPEAVEKTLTSGLATFWSRSRGKLWVKGETSGQTMRVRWVRTDCDADALLVGVDPVGPACHNGYASCFYRELQDQEWVTIAEPVKSPEELYGKPT